MKTINLTIDSDNIAEYNQYYLQTHPKATKPQMKYPYHESINVWMIMKRPMMNSLKQRWKQFMVWLIDKQGY